MDPFLMTLLAVAFLFKSHKNAQTAQAAYHNGKEPPNVVKARLAHEKNGAPTSRRGRPKGRSGLGLMASTAWANACQSAADRMTERHRRRQNWLDSQKDARDAAYTERRQRKLDKRQQRLNDQKVRADKWRDWFLGLTRGEDKQRKQEREEWRQKARAGEWARYRNAMEALGVKPDGSLPTHQEILYRMWQDETGQTGPGRSEPPKAAGPSPANPSGPANPSAAGQPAGNRGEQANQDSANPAGTAETGAGPAPGSGRGKPAADNINGSETAQSFNQQAREQGPQESAYSYYASMGSTDVPPTDEEWARRHQYGRTSDFDPPEDSGHDSEKKDPIRVDSEVVRPQPPEPLQLEAGSASTSDQDPNVLDAEVVEDDSTPATGAATSAAPATPTGGTTVYEQAVTRLIAAADRVAEYRSDLASFADTLRGKRWGVEVTGPVQDMNGQLTALEGEYRDLAAQMKTEGDAGVSAHEQAPWVPADDSILV